MPSGTVTYCFFFSNQNGFLSLLLKWTSDKPLFLYYMYYILGRAETDLGCCAVCRKPPWSPGPSTVAYWTQKYFECTLNLHFSASHPPVRNADVYCKHSTASTSRVQIQLISAIVSPDIASYRL